MAESEVAFYSDRLRIAGYLHTPEDWHAGDAPRPGILMLSGYGGNPHFDCIHLMRRLCADGWFVFTFDYRGFGNSEGERGRHRPLEQAQDAFDALSWMQTEPGIDPQRLGVFGTSFGAAHGIWVAAHDERVKCLVASAAVTHGERWLRLLRRPWEWLDFHERVFDDARRRVRSGEPTIVQRGDIMLRDPDALRQRAAQAPSGAALPPEDIDLESAEACMRYRPEWVVDRIAPRPVLMLCAERDALVPPEEQLACFERCGEPRRLVRLPGAGHYDTYEFRNPAVSDIVHQETAAWFTRYL
ncbi:MAG: alpha/beta fold hydrolase [Proteobacteria bacterium]|nr:alpha/beta fold hydrolase [Burkholderiales bacterium]